VSILVQRGKNCLVGPQRPRPGDRLRPRAHCRAGPADGCGEGKVGGQGFRRNATQPRAEASPPRPWHPRREEAGPVECGDRSPLSHWETCLPVPKRGHVRALHRP
jgi:hypothetical protein